MVRDEDGSEWYPFVIPAKLDLNSPANIGKLVLDAPAGKHGFVTVKDGHFYFEDGTRARFWGTNLCFGSCFPTRKQAKILAERLSFFGFNAVRLHHMDHFEPMGIFEDIDPVFKDPQMKQTGVLSKRQLDRLDYFIYQLKQHGIYININLLVSRNFTLADDVTDANQLDIAGKPLSIFDRRMIDLQKDYAQELLTHYNPYTKLTYAEDPAIAFIEITNENSLYTLKFKKIPTYYAGLLEKLWTDWKIKKPATVKNDKNLFYEELQREYFQEMTCFLRNRLGVKALITGIGGFYATADIKTQETCDFIAMHEYWDYPKFPGKRWDSNNFTMHRKSMLLDPKQGIIDIIQRNAALIKKPLMLTEWNVCFPNKYAYETPILIATKVHSELLEGAFQFAFMHSWKSENILKYIRSFFNTVANPQQLMLSSASSLLIKNIHLKVNYFVDDGVLRINSAFIKGASGQIKDLIFDFEDISISSKDNGSVFLIPLNQQSDVAPMRFLLLTIGEVKNTNGKWINNRYCWGVEPTSLKKMCVQIKLKSANKMKVYELTNQGSISKQIYGSDDTRKQHQFTTEHSETPWFIITTE
ncbi:MAG: hypothetical protein MJA29_12985 [Candidatus Omnitrophica bacterium]|nr:hypothetical protein [Candidatus Omnitrophota bacterium]